MPDLAVVGGVDTHKHTHHAAVLGADGTLIASQEFRATTDGHRELVAWLLSHGDIAAVGVEGTGSFGAPVARHLEAHQVRVIEVNRPNREARRRQGKSDSLDVEQAARAVLAGTATATPKSKNGTVKVIRMLRIARNTAVKSRTQAMNAIHSIIVTAPDALRDELLGLSKATGFHPIYCFADATGEALGVLLRPGNAGADTIADQTSPGRSTTRSQQPVDRT